MALLSNLPFWVRKFDPSYLDFEPEDYAELLQSFSQSTEKYDWSSQTSRLVGTIPFEKVYSFLLWSIGISYVDSDGVLRRELPCMHPHWSNQYCVSVQVTPIAPNVQDPKVPKSAAPEGRKQVPFYSNYQEAQVTMDFAPPPPGVNYFTDAELGIYKPNVTVSAVLLDGGYFGPDDIVVTDTESAFPFQAGQTVDISWTNADGSIGGRIGMSVDNVGTSPNTLTITGGTGENIPAIQGLVIDVVGLPAQQNEVLSEANRFVFLDRQPFSELISIPTGSVIMTLPSGQVDALGETFIPVRQAKLMLKWYRVPIEYVRLSSDGTYPLIEGAIGTINSKSFLGYPAGTLLFDQSGPKITPVSIPVQRENGVNPQIPWLVDIEIPLIWRDPPNGDPESSVRGHLLRPAPYGTLTETDPTAKWYEAKYKGGASLFQSTDFYQMFKGLRQVGLA